MPTGPRLCLAATLLGAVFSASHAGADETSSQPAAAPAAAPTPPAPPSCDSPRHAELDFWIGDWSLSWAGGGAGENHVRRTLGGCVIEERFTEHGGTKLVGQSASVFDVASGEWRQTWVDNQASYLTFAGGPRDGNVELRGERTVQGKQVLTRMVFHKKTADAFDWSWEASRDGGKSWKVNWLIHYQRK